MKKKSRLHSYDIHRNSSVQISHTILKIKEHERRYTFILVVFFLCCFCFVGYEAFVVPTKTINSIDLSNNVQSLAPTSTGVSFSGRVFGLSSSSMMSSLEGLSSLPIYYEIQNNSLEDYPYQIVLVFDELNQKKCGCFNHVIDLQYLRFSLDGKTVHSFSDSSFVIDEDVLKVGEARTYSIRIWVDQEALINDDDHFHGYFVLQKK